MKVVDELVAEFLKKEKRHSRLERPGVRVYDLILRSPSGWPRLAVRLEEATERHGEEQAT
jgi:hypothetical protein